jgi:GntR family transcriptional regulator
MSVHHLVQAEPGQSRYGALAVALRARVIAGEWPPGTAIPAEQTLAAEHGVALGTMRRALELLAQQGIIERIQGRGTFVRAGLSGATMMRFFRFGDASGEIPSSRILKREVIHAAGDASRALGVAKGEPVLKLKRLRSLGGHPCLVEDIWLLLPGFRALVESSTQDWGDLLYPMYAERCGIYIQRAVDEIRFDAFGATDSRILGLTPSHPSARVTRMAFDVAGQCVEYRVSRGDAHAFNYTVSIT